MVNNKRIHVIMNVTHCCNLACQYCYYNKEMDRKPGNMSLSTVERIFEQVAKSSASSVDFTIHGGEPLLRDSRYYTEFFRLQQLYLGKRKVNNSIQTNGTLIDEYFIKNYVGLKKEGINLGIGISLDGPREIHDTFRLYKKSRTGSFEDVMNNIELMDKESLSIAILGVAPLTIPERATLLYNFFKSIKNLHFLDMLVPRYDSFPSIPDNSLSMIYITVFNSWFFDKSAYFDIRFFCSVILAFLSGKGNLCTFQNDCITNNMMLSIRSDGDASFCDSFPKVKLGNIWKDDVDCLVDKNNKVRKGLSIKEEKRLEGCLFCKWFNMCNGGCPSNHVPGADLPQYFCEEYQRIFSHIESMLNSVHLCVKEGLGEESLKKIVNPRLQMYLRSHRIEREKCQHSN